MTNLIIYTDTLTAVEVYCGDDIKYVESFPNWSKLLETLSKYMNEYAWIEVKSKYSGF